MLAEHYIAGESEWLTAYKCATPPAEFARKRHGNDTKGSGTLPSIRPR